VNATQDFEILKRFQESRKSYGRQRYSRTAVGAIRSLLEAGYTVNEISNKSGIPKTSIYGIKRRPTIFCSKPHYEMEPAPNPAEFTIKVGNVEITTNDKSVLSAILELAGGK
jgi:hypothetical protein